MRFTLIYDGRLLSTGNSPKDASGKKWEVRAQFDPQLRRLWDEHPELRYLRKDPFVRKDGRYIMTQPHPLHPEAEVEQGPFPEIVRPENQINLCEEISKGSRKFFPLVRKTLAITCGLKILFLRHEPRGRLLQGGDLDNRIKTLVDALGIPREESPYENASLQDPVFVLYKDDSLVTAIDVRTERLLAPTADAKNQVRLVIEVDVRVSQPRPFNMPFSGD